jgi:hypothetical protein
MNAILTLQRRIRLVKYREIIGDNLSKAGWSWGVSAIDSQRRTIWIVDAHRGDGKCVVVRVDETSHTRIIALRKCRRSAEPGQSKAKWVG